MRNSTLITAIALAVSVTACASSGAHTETTRLSRLSAEQGLGGLWVGSEEAQPGGEILVARHDDEARADLWMKTGTESNPEGTPRQPTPRLDWVLHRLTPSSTSSFVESSWPSRARN